MSCGVLWDEEGVEAAHRLYREAWGRECPCLTGERSPFAPRDMAVKVRAVPRPAPLPAIV